MKAWVAVVLHSLLNSHIWKCSAEPTPFDEVFSGSSVPPRRRLPIHIVNSLLISEAHTEFGSHRQLTEEIHDSWNSHIDSEWSRAIELENTVQKNALRRATVSKGTSPYLVCDEEPGKSGERCHATVREWFGSDMNAVSNQPDMTCYIVSALASKAYSASDLLIVNPLLPIMKMEQGIIDRIKKLGQEVPRQFESILCPGQVSTDIDASLSVEDILSRAMQQEDASGRRLTTNLFTRSDVDREMKDYERYGSGQEFWNRTLKNDINESVCNVVFDSLEASVPEKGESFSFRFPVNSTHDDDDVRKCLLLLVTAVSYQPEVCWIGIVPDMVPLNSEAQWVSQSRVVESRPFFDVGLDGAGTIIGVSDTGLDTDNCYFWDASGDVQKDGSVDLSRRKVVQYVALGDESDDMKGHGTHVAGTAAGCRAVDGENESPGAVDGIAPGAKLSFVDLGVSGKERLNIPSPPSSIYEHGLRAGSKVHSSSWGIGYNFYGFAERDLDLLMVDNPDLLIVLAAGNSGDTANAVGSPATCKNAITVGASQNARAHTTTGMRGHEYLAWFSSAGPTHDGRMKPEVVAPGYYIRSAEARPEMQGECDDQDENSTDGLMYSAGTSMSAPIVAGTAAIIRQYFEEGWYPTGDRVQANSMIPSSSLVKAVLINGAQRLSGRQYKNLTVSASDEYDEHQGFGAITLIESLPLAGKNDIKAHVIDRKSIRNGDDDVYRVTIDNSNGCSAPLSATLAWTDPPGTAGCALCLLNNLDLHVSDVTQTTSYFANGKSYPDTVNNAERVRIENVSDGAEYVVHVKGANLETASQQYSLIISGCLGEPTNARSSRQSQQMCPSDQRGSILVDNETRTETCSWLESNKIEYEYLCTFTDVVTMCPATCGFCPSVPLASEKRFLGTQMDGTVQWFGTMFNIEVKSNITVTSLSFHSASTDSVGVKVYTKKGVYDMLSGSDHRPADWTLISNATVQAKGISNPTTIPIAVFDEVVLKEGDIQAFYIDTGSMKDVIMSGNSHARRLELHEAWSENDDLSILTGSAVTGSFAGTYPLYAWNGIIYYSLRPACKDSNANVAVDGVGDRSCDWLSQNQARFGFLCNRIQVATTCPLTCNFCDSIAY